MNIENLTSQEVEQLQMLLNKLNPQPVIDTLPDYIDEMIVEILDEFDFDTVESTMNRLGWKWWGENVTINMLKNEARRLLRGAAKNRLGIHKDEYWEIPMTHNTGGLHAQAFCNEDKTKIIALNLKFVLTEWVVEIED
jgi:hypothetical protein